jgi:hypothetical protein
MAKRKIPGEMLRDVSSTKRVKNQTHHPNNSFCHLQTFSVDRALIGILQTQKTGGYVKDLKGVATASR